MQTTTLTLHGLWSFGTPAPTTLSPLGQRTVIIGPNNAGKSNILRAVRKLQSADPNNFYKFPDGETHIPRGSPPLPTPIPPHFTATCLLDAAALDEIQTRLAGALTETDLTLLRSSTIRITWQPQAAHPPHQRSALYAEVLLLDPQGQHLQLPSSALWPAFRERVLQVAAERIVHVPAWRRRDDRPFPHGSLSETIDVLKRAKTNLQSNSLLYEEIRARFMRLSALADVELNSTSPPDSVNVKVNGRVLELHQLGDGLQQLLHLAMTLTLYPHHVLLIEEPELHLHPRLQRRLAEMLSTHRGQILLTTHSPVFLDSNFADCILRVSHDGHSSHVQKIGTPPEVRALLDDLDLRASDLLQANVVVWVEGPTDRILIRRCLELVDPNLREGIDYHLMYYSGKMRAHLTAADEAASELINLLPLGRHVAVIADSDRGGEEEEIQAPVLRLAEEARAAGGYVWTTAGREFENYLDPSLVRSVLEIPPDAICAEPGRFGRFDDWIVRLGGLVPYGKRWFRHFATNKSRVMTQIAPRLEARHLDRFDLRERVTELAAFIRSKSA